MPQNIVVGEEAEAVAEFVAEYAGSDVPPTTAPSSGGDSASGESSDSGS
jgi:hypothetical protein